MMPLKSTMMGSKIQIWNYKGKLMRSLFKENLKNSDCSFCPLYKCKSQEANIFHFDKTKKAGILIVGEEVSKTEFEDQLLLTNSYNSFWVEWLEEKKLFGRGTFDYVPFINCFFDKYSFSVENKKKIKDYCSAFLYEFIQKSDYRIIIIMGESAFKSLYASRLSSRIGVTDYNDKWIGYIIPDLDLKKEVFLLQAPSTLDFNVSGKEKNRSKFIFLENLEKAFKADGEVLLIEALSLNSKMNSVETSTNLDVVNIFLDHIIEKANLIAFDYETNGKKPYDNEGVIVCMSISYAARTLAFPIFEDAGFLERIKKILTNEKIKKISHNMKFEQNWTRFCLGYSVEGWLFDTIISAHILDNRKGVTGLKFCTFNNFGITDYDSDTAQYIETSGKDPYEKNKLAFVFWRRAGIRDQILQYCAMDSFYTYHLALKHIDNLAKKPNLRKAYDYFHRLQLALADVEFNGFPCSVERLLEEELKIDKELLEIDEKIKLSAELKEWQKAYPRKAFNSDSPDQLGDLLYNILNVPMKNKTKGGKGSTDVDALEGIDLPFIKLLLRHRKLSKIKGTYIAGFKRECKSGYIHPSLNLNLVSTYRSSCTSPNLQNIPVRDLIAKEILRSCIVPKNDFLIGADYSQIEVIASACYHKDPNMIAYILDPSTNMHTDTAADLFFRESKDVLKTERQAAKNGFVFAQFYGDWWLKCAENVWDQLDDETKAHLKSKGVHGLGFVKRDHEGKITEVTGFYKVVQEVENIFWNERFPIYKEWKKTNWKKYIKRGVIDYYTGFEAASNLEKNQANNTAFQGSAFHIMGLALCEINDYLKANNMKTKVILEIHDDILMDVDKEEWEGGLKKVVEEKMIKYVREYWKWIILPLKVEFTYYVKNWATAEKKEVVTL